MTDTTGAPAAAGAEAPDLRATLETAFKESETKNNSATDAAASSVDAGPSAQPDANGDPGKSGASERVRGPDGKFAKGDETAPGTKELKTTDQPATAPAATAPAEKQHGDATARWSAADKAILAKQTPEAQGLLKSLAAKQDAEFTRKSQELAATRQGKAELDHALEPVRQTLALNGLSEGAYVRSLVAADQALQTDPERAIKWLANRYGIDLARVVTSGTQPAYVDPELKAVKEQVEQLTGYTRQQQESANHAAFQGRLSDVQAFAASGEAPHFEAVQADIPALVAIIRQREPGLPNRDVLEKAYERAVWQNPETRALLQAEAEEKRIAEQRAKATQASRAAVSVTGAPGGATNPAAGGLSLREEIAAQMAARS